MNDSSLRDFSLDIFGQQPRTNLLYTQITFCYQLAGDGGACLPSQIINTLESGFRRLSENFPWIAGKITNEDGTFKIKPTNGSHHVVVKDYTNNLSVPDWNTSQQANFPFRLLEGALFAPCKTLESSSEGLLVFLIQVNFVRGRGLLLTLNGQHGAMDMAGFAQVMYLLSKACRDEAFTEEELSIGNMDRKNIIPLLDEDARGSEDGHNTPWDDNLRQAQKDEAQPFDDCAWAYFSFSQEKLSDLKAQATATLPAGTSEFISTDDALSAFVWRSISRARLRHYVQLNRNASNLQTTLSRNVDVRRHLGIPATYPGFATDTTVHRFPLEEVSSQSLGFLSSELRSALVPQSLSQHAREIATRISREMTSNNTTSVPKSRPECEVRLSSWAKEKCCSLDFGFGLPIAVRRPLFTDGSRDGLVYFLPKSLDGEIVVGICLKCEVMDMLKSDECFIRFGTFIG